MLYKNISICMDQPLKFLPPPSIYGDVNYIHITTNDYEIIFNVPKSGFRGRTMKAVTSCSHNPKMILYKMGFYKVRSKETVIKESVWF